EPARCEPRSQVGPGGGQRQQDRHPGSGANGEDLEDAQGSGELADRDRHGGKRHERAGHPYEDAGDIAADHEGSWRPVVYSASGWFSGRAFSKAASFWQAASTAMIFWNRSIGTFMRRALATCGTRQMSAIVTCWPNAYGPGLSSASIASKPAMIQCAYQASIVGWS